MINKLLDAAKQLLMVQAALPEVKANELVAIAFRGEINQLKRNDARRFLRFMADQVPPLRIIRSLARDAYSASGKSSTPSDPRFPSEPVLMSDHPAVRAVKRAVSVRRQRNAGVSS